jgi:dolichyldiphosphatase
MVVLGVGLIFDERVNAVIKETVREPRPMRPATAAAAASPVWSEHGMPSSHTQFMFFFATFVALWLLTRVRCRHERNHAGGSEGGRDGASSGGASDVSGGGASSTGTKGIDRGRGAISPDGASRSSDGSSGDGGGGGIKGGACCSGGGTANGGTTATQRSVENIVLDACLGPRAILIFKLLVVALFYGLAAAVGYSRVYLHYHTTRQVQYGALTGLVSATAWFLFVDKVASRWFPAIEELAICKALLIKDSSLVDNVLLFEYETQRVEKLRVRKSETGRASGSNAE